MEEKYSLHISIFASQILPRKIDIVIVLPRVIH